MFNMILFHEFIMNYMPPHISTNTNCNCIVLLALADADYKLLYAMLELMVELVSLCQE